MNIVCEEIFDETSHPSIEEIKDYATKLGIDPDSEPQLLPLAAEGLMKALPPGWKPCYDDKKKSYYYYNNLTKKSQWEHPLDDIYRGLVKKARAESQSLSLGEPTEDATYGRDELPSYEEPVNFAALKFDRKKDVKLSPIKVKSPLDSPKKLFTKQKSEDLINLGNIDVDEMVSVFSKHPRSIEKPELKVIGGGLSFLKSKKKDDSKNDDTPKSILRDRIEHSKSVEFDKISLLDKSENDEDKKSVRFNLESTDNALTFSDKSFSDEDLKNDIINVKLTPSKSRFTVRPVLEPTLKLIKPNPSDFIKPKLTISKNSDSEEDSFIKNLEKQGKHNPEAFFEETSPDSPSEENMKFKSRKLEEKAEKKVNLLKQSIWEEKNEEIVKFRCNLKESHNAELERILINEKTVQEDKIKAELENLRKEMESRSVGTLKSERSKMENHLENIKKDIENKLKIEEESLKKHFDTKKEELEKYYEEKLADVEKELAEKVETNRDELLLSHNSIIEQLKQNHSIIIDELKREFQQEEKHLRKEHQLHMSEIKNKNGDKDADTTYEKLRCEKRLLEDKYRCLKEKYLRLKTEVKISIEKRHKKKESTTTNTTGSETEQSHSNNKERSPLNSPKKISDKPPTPKSQGLKEQRNKPHLQDIDTSISDHYQSEEINKNEPANEYDSSDTSMNNPGRNRKRVFFRQKSNSASRVNGNKNKKPPRACSPVENLRRQLQKLEDLEDQFPQNPQSDTYHLRYPFTDDKKFEGSSELEFFRHRIHLERDSIKRAKESLRSQKTVFQQRQKDLKLKHGSMARHTLQQLCQEEKEITDMEVSLHRTRSLLGEKVIRLRHLEQSLQRANFTKEQKLDDATLSDISSHSASSGISSTEFATADANYGKSIIKAEHFQESSEIIQSLENLNSEIREIWDVLKTQQQHSSLASVIPPFVYPDLGWPILAGAANVMAAAAASSAPPSIPTLADRLHNYRQQVALANAQGTVVTHAHQGATTTLVERTKNLRHWLRQNGAGDVVNEGNNLQANL
ncbi:unnamed protein product [Brassicogethes aeneus]|uniref:WW domain-containing protein n=1 Tax=Brassicogethes aeneus TaxID=1431903 RepID=A0A9P0B9S4_BRAAE|nr:unnamed protein product [Brassicogethes aeneus]